MKQKYSFDHIRQKDGESLAEWFVRVIGWAIADSKGRDGRIRYALHHLEQLAHNQGRVEAFSEAKETHERDTDALQKKIDGLEAMLRRSVSKVEAEEARQKAAIAMRLRASLLAEDLDGMPNSLSEEIYALPLPKPLWTEAKRAVA